MPTSEQAVDDAALTVARNLDVALFFWELHEEYPNINTLNVDAERLRRLWGIDVSDHLPRQSR